MSKTKITIRRVCPACDGRGTSFGPRRCGACNGRHKVKETITIEEEDDGDDAHAARRNVEAATEAALRDMMGGDYE